VLPGVQGGGWGGKLCQAALEWLECDGPRTLWISVWSENLGAQRFYARHGFEKAGEYEFPVGRVRDHEFVPPRAPPLSRGTPPHAGRWR
jgi:ribosomal protein S18 acetylase RimI-like enzyme